MYKIYKVEQEMKPLFDKAKEGKITLEESKQFNRLQCKKILIQHDMGGNNANK